MTIKRMMTQIRFWMFLGNGYKRAEYAKKKQIYAEIGENSKIPIALPLYPKLVRVHNNVIMHRSVKLVTHDDINSFLMRMSKSYQYKHPECLNPIEIFDNVYIGMDTIILGNVRIGPNAIINAGSLIVNDVPPDSIVGGVPAKVVGRIDQYAKIRTMKDKAITYEFKRNGPESIDEETVEKAWKKFDNKRGKLCN